MSKYSVGDFQVGDRIAASGDDKQSQHLGTVTDVNKKIITITWENGLSAEYTPKQMQSYGYQKFLEDEVRTFKVGVACFSVGDRFEIISPKKYSGEKGCFSGYHRDDSPEFWVKLDNHDLQIRVFPNQVKFLEDKEAIASCNSHNLTSAQESESPKNLLTGIINTSEDILENGKSNLSELRQGIHFVQSEPEVLQQGMQVPERKGRHQFRGSDRNVRVRNDSSESGGTLWGEAENNLEVVQGSGVQMGATRKSEIIVQ